MKEVNQEKGITLIALVITIIVLLILAGVTIAMLTADNSAPQKATEAAQKDAISATKDDVAMAAGKAMTDYYENKYVSTANTAGDDMKETAGDAVKKEVKTVLGNHKGNGQIIEATVEETADETDGSYDITITTKDFNTAGTISKNGSISWKDSWATTAKE